MLSEEPVNQERRSQGMRNFIGVWAGQFLSLLGSSMTSFALGIWAWQQEGEAMPLALIGFFTYAPLILVTPFAGVLVDRWNRKWIMILSDLGAGMSTLAILGLMLTGSLQLWHIYVLTGIASACQGFQWPAYSTAISLLVPKEHFGRASGLIAVAENGSYILAPILAGIFLGFTGIHWVLIIDLLTCAAAIIILLLIVIPSINKKITETGETEDLLQRFTFGFRYILERKSLLGLQLVFLGANFMTVLGYGVLAPMILARSDNNAQLLGAVQSIAAIGGVLGGLALTFWGGPGKKIDGVLIGWLLSGLLGRFLTGITASPLVWSASVFMLAFIMPTINGSNQAIWQSKIPLAYQGRVFSARRLIAQVSIPLAMLLSGLMADHIFEPAMQDPGTWLSQTLGSVFGSVEGSGMSLMITVSGLLVSLVAILGLSSSVIRNINTLIPDNSLQNQ